MRCGCQKRIRKKKTGGEGKKEIKYVKPLKKGRKEIENLRTESPCSLQQD